MLPNTSPSDPFDAAAGPPGLLRVECVPSPDPLPVSTPSKTKNGVLSLTFSKPDGAADVRCRSITVSLPVGTTAADLASSPAPLDGNQDGGQGSWLIVPQRGDEAVVFTCTPEGPGSQVTFDATRRFTLKVSAIPVVRTPGHAALTITEHTTPATSDDWADRTVSTDPVEKHLESPSAFHFRGFAAERPQIVNDGKATVVLRWEGSEAGTGYWLAWDDRPPIEVSGGSHPVGPLTDTTTFVLDARTKDAQGKDVHHYLSTTVTVKNPDIAAKTLSATDKVTVTDTFWADNKNARKTWARNTAFEGDVTMSGKLTVGGELQADGNVTVKSDKELKAGKVTAGGVITANDGLTVKSDKTLKAAALAHPTAGTAIKVNDTLLFQGTAGLSIPQNGGAITVYGALTAKAGAQAGEGELTANGPLTANKTVKVTGTLTANGSVSFATALFGSPTRKNYPTSSVKPRSTSKWTMTADRNGFLVVEAASYEWFSDDEKHGRKHRVYVEAPGMTYYFDLVAHGKKTRQNTQGVWDNMTVPLARNATAKVWIEDIDDVANANGNVQMNICWYPMGAV
ncbi:hypothetical protein ACFXPX_19670 [Kitasatospora sp. NPDC059146]|uniref:hypothetical protein n=1 Tax=Kitasatospora sp. NPDC059146 TaxID=3346741 RepID=UPI0036868D8F